MHNASQRREDPLVTGVLERWDGQGLTGDPWPFVSLCSLSRLQQLLARALDPELKRFRISRTGYFVLTTLALITGRCSPLSTLGRMLMVHPTTVKLTIDQLEAQGLVTRRPHPTDRRATLVQLTDEGLSRIRAANEALGSARDGLLGGLQGQYQDLAEALQRARFAAGDTGPDIEADLPPLPPAEPVAGSGPDAAPGITSGTASGAGRGAAAGSGQGGAPHARSGTGAGVADAPYPVPPRGFSGRPGTLPAQ